MRSKSDGLKTSVFDTVPAMMMSLTPRFFMSFIVKPKSGFVMFTTSSAYFDSSPICSLIE